MRARWLKPEFFTDKKIATTDPSAALVFEALWCWADDGGVCICDPDWLKSQVFFRWEFFTVKVISDALRALYDLKMIYVYKVGDDYYASIRHWKRHQSVHKPAKFRHPRPDEQLTFERSELPPSAAGASPGASPASPTPRHLDSNNPRVLDAVEGQAGELTGHSPNGNGGGVRQPTSLDDLKTGKTAGELSLARELETDADRLALTTICASVPAAAQWVAEANVSLQGMHGPPLTPRQLGDALKQFVGKGFHLQTPAPFRVFQVFLRNAANPEPEAKGSSDQKAGTAATTTGEAGSILGKVKAMAKTFSPQSGGAVSRIAKTDVESLGADVALAIESIGGGDVILNTPPARWGLLVRDFAAALSHARTNGNG